MHGTEQRRIERVAANLDVRPVDRPPSAVRRPAFWLFWLRGVVVDCIPAIVLYAGFAVVRWVFPEYAPEAGARNARRVMAAQDALGIGWDRAWQDAALRSEALITFLNWYYIVAFAPFLLVAGVVALWRSPVLFERWRIVFVVTLTLTVATQAVFPVTPPRLLPGEAGLVDTLAIYGPSYYGGSDPSSAGVFNVHGAMPSMHVGWSAFAAVVLWSAVGRPWWLVPPLVVVVATMAFAVVATGNHYLLDAIVGVGIILVSIAVIRLWRGERWDRADGTRTEG